MFHQIETIVGVLTDHDIGLDEIRRASDTPTWFCHCGTVRGATREEALRHQAVMLMNALGLSIYTVKKEIGQ